MIAARTIEGVRCGQLNTVVIPPLGRMSRWTLLWLPVAVRSRTGWNSGVTKTQTLALGLKFPLGSQILSLSAIFAAVPFYPESPRYISRKGQLDQVRDILELCGVNSNISRLDIRFARDGPLAWCVARDFAQKTDRAGEVSHLARWRWT